MVKVWSSLLLCIVSWSACSRSGDLVVQAALGRDAAGAAVAIDRIVIELLPYDRDSIFDALAALADRPEPEIPADLLAMRDSLAMSRQLWTEAESQWNAVRDELVSLSERMRAMNRGSREYRQAFVRFTELETREQALNRTKDEAFRQYETLQRRYAARADSIRVARFNWEDVAFARYGEIVDSLLRATRREIHTDTTRRGGYAAFRVSAGRWYVHARYELPLEELYFNVPVTVEAGRVDTLRLTRDTAEVRPLL